MGGKIVPVCFCHVLFLLHRPGQDPEAEIKELHAKIGELTMDRDLLSEKLGRYRARSARP